MLGRHFAALEIPSGRHHRLFRDYHPTSARRPWASPIMCERQAVVVSTNSDLKNHEKNWTAEGPAAENRTTGLVETLPRPSQSHRQDVREEWASPSKTSPRGNIDAVILRPVACANKKQNTTRASLRLLALHHRRRGILVTKSDPDLVMTQRRHQRRERKGVSTSRSSRSGSANKRP